MTAFDLQLSSTSAFLQWSKGPGHRPRAARGHCLIGPSVANIQEVGVDIAESNADLLSWYTTAIADGPRPEAGEDPIQMQN